MADDVSKFTLAFQRADAARLRMPDGYRERPGPNKVYCILITPRSGSTWLSQEIARLEVMSHPDEYFLTEQFHDALLDNPCKDLKEYYEIVSKKRMTESGVFGLEISFFDLEELEREVQLFDLLPKDRHFVYLSRRNFVAQGVSLYLAIETRRFHSLREPDTPDGRERPARYDGQAIKYWTAHILDQEYSIEQWMQAHDVTPLRVSYEDMLQNMDAVIAKIAEWIGVDVDVNRERLPLPSPRRLYSGVNREFEARFREENRAWCDEWDEFRAGWHARLKRLDRHRAGRDAAISY
jgi:LPS sulfotransferase NodH